MATLDYSAAGVPVPDDMQAAHRYMWDLIRRPGPQWTGAQRVAIAAEARRADTCAFCHTRKAALSPTAVSGTHDTASALPAHVVDVIHRIRSDPGRLSRAWFESVRAAGLDDVAYVELVAVVTMVTGVDYFCRSLDMPPFSLPDPLPGEPTRYRPAGAKPGTAWVAMLAPEDATGAEADMYPPSPMIPNIVRALSLVPDAVRALGVSTNAHYLPVAEIGNPTARPAALDRMQTELVAARVSALNQCFY
jgi:alkylhydroperoxidase family enzyme